MTAAFFWMDGRYWNPAPIQFIEKQCFKTRSNSTTAIAEHKLPFHPLVAEGYSSIGCTHCTVKGEGRSGRWLGKPKTECGLHL